MAELGKLTVALLLRAATKESTDTFFCDVPRELSWAATGLAFLNALYSSPARETRRTGVVATPRPGTWIFRAAAGDVDIPSGDESPRRGKFGLDLSARASGTTSCPS